MNRNQKTIVLLDGYNAIHRVPEWKRKLPHDLEGARESLVRFCREVRNRRRDIGEIRVVFDGDRSAAEGTPRAAGPGVRVVFSGSPEKADDRILAMLRDEGPRHVWTVVSDDEAVRRGARAFGAAVVAVAAFLAAPSRASRPGATSESGGKTPLAPADVQRLNDELKRVWGLT